MPLHDLAEFLKLSASLNYNLSAASINRYNVLLFITGSKSLHPDVESDRQQKALLMEALSYLFSAYSQKRRRLGPLAVLHPLRSTALFARTHNDLQLIDMLTHLFHDILEDIHITDFTRTAWSELEEQLLNLFSRLGADEQDDLNDRLVCLTRNNEESYFHYIWRLFNCRREPSKLLQVKLADRLDNTLDMRIALQDPIEGIDFFQTVFELLFAATYKGHLPETLHPPAEVLNGAKRLYQLFKNAVLLSLIRQKSGIMLDRTSQILFNAVAEASLKEAQRTFIHVIGYHYKDTTKQRTLVLEAMEYCFSGKSDLVTKPDSSQLLDGLFASYFGQNSSKVRDQRIDTLYQNKPLMLQASIAFLVIFINFLNDPHYYVHGISASGIDPR